MSHHHSRIVKTMNETEIIPLEVAYPYYDLSEVEIWEDAATI